ncbi:hypothetical protein [Parendozoicomonas haliclonae]|uniref:Uncharacterized protein n=1 Tax=Parendozoicomonas haliclonae TaxID=1960125 RepID=A0A1X7AJU5_9GAMM|nr:hypothetical protein [Parendozoicomonas haliclonae]SMA47224.1 hypothetical protein EHSB41UT_02346 [Parendozoicomonas haliclonae]
MNRLSGNFRKQKHTPIPPQQGKPPKSSGQKTKKGRMQQLRDLAKKLPGRKNKDEKFVDPDKSQTSGVHEESRPLVDRETREHGPVQPEVRQSESSPNETPTQQLVTPDHDPLLNPQPSPKYKVDEQALKTVMEETALQKQLSETESDAGSVSSDTPSVLSELNVPELEEIEDLDKFLEERVAPNAKKSKRNALEKMVGFLAEKIVKKYLPVDNEDSRKHQDNINTLTEQLKQITGRRRRLLKERGELTDAHAHISGKVGKSRTKVEKKLLEIADKQKASDKLETKVEEETAQAPKRRNVLARIAHHSDPVKKQTKLKGAIKELESELANLHTKLDGRIKERERLEALMKAAVSEEEQLNSTSNSLMDQIQVEKGAVLATQKQRKEFNKQVVSLALNLRRIHQNKAALGSIRVPHLKIPMGDDALDLKEVSFRPAAIKTRIDADGQPLVDVTLKDIKAVLDAPIDNGVMTDLDVGIDGLTVTLGGPVAKSMKAYLDGKSAAIGINMGKMMSTVVKSIQAGNANTDAPVYVGANIGKVTVNTKQTNAEVIVRAVAKARSTPGSALHKAIANLRLPVSVNVEEVNVHTAPQVQPGDKQLSTGEAVKIDARVNGITIDLIPDTSEAHSEKQRNAQLGISAKSASVTVNSPVGLAASTVRKLLPKDPMQALPEPLRVLTDEGALDKVPESLCEEVNLDMSDLNVRLGRNVNLRTTEASPDKPVWFVEGDSENSVTAGRVHVQTWGNLNASAGLSNLHLKASQQGENDTLRFSVAPNENSDEPSAVVDFHCEPGLVKSLAKLTGQQAMNKMLVEGGGRIAIDGKVAVTVDNGRNTVTADLEKGRVGVNKAFALRTDDLHVQLPESIDAQVRDVNVTVSPVREYRGSKIKHTEMRVGQIALEGDGEIRIDTFFPATPPEGEQDSESLVRNHFTIPLHGYGELNNTRVENIQSMSDENKVMRSRVVLHPGRVLLKNVDAKSLRVGEVNLNLDAELNGELNVKGAQLRFNDLLFPQVRYETGQEQVDIQQPPPLPRPLRWMLKNKVLKFEGNLPVSQGRIDMRKAAATRLVVKTDKLKPSLGDRITSGLINIGLRAGLTLMGGKILHLDQQRNHPVIRSPLLRDLTVPLPDKAAEYLAVTDKGTVDLASTQYLASGLYCLPESRQKELDRMLERVLASEQSVPLLDELVTRCEENIHKAATMQEAFYLMNGLPIEVLVKKAAGNRGIQSALERIVALAIQHPRSHAVALDIFNQGIQPTNEQLAHLQAQIKADNPLSTRLAQLLFDLSYVSQAEPLLVDIVKKDPRNQQAMALLAQIDWARGRREDALLLVRDAAQTASSAEEYQQLISLLGAWVETDGHEQSTAIMQARLLAASLSMRQEVKSGNADAFLKAVKELEKLAQTQDKLGTAQSAREQLASRFEQAWQISEKLDLEPWEVWSSKVSDAGATLKKGKSIDLSEDDKYLAALGLMYGYRGIAIDQTAAQLMWLAMDPLPDSAKVHLDILNERLAQKKAA